MNSNVPPPREQVRAATASKFSVLARIPDVFVEANRPGAPIAVHHLEPTTTSEVATALETEPSKNNGSRRSDRVVNRNSRTGRAMQPVARRSSKLRQQRRPPIIARLSTTHWVLMSLIGFLLVVIVVLLTRRNQPASVEDIAPNWPPESQNDLVTNSSNHQATTSGLRSADQASGPNVETQPAVTAAEQSGGALQPAPSPAINTDTATAGTIRLNGTIGKPDRQARQPRNNGQFR